MKLFSLRQIQEEVKRLHLIGQLSGIKPPVAYRDVIWFGISVFMAAGVVLWLQSSDLSREAVWMSGIFTLAALLWVTEALPLFATAILIISLEIILLANPGNWPGLGFASGNNPDYRVFLAPLADPIIVLFFGGFLLARASVKEGVDKALASTILRFFGRKPSSILLGLMIITAVFSMWMSNTATTAMMITLVIPIIDQLPENERFNKALLLGVPFAANIGGMGTPIASPPNAVAVAFLGKEGLEISFATWMLIGVPLVILLLVFAWRLLYFMYKPSSNGINIQPLPLKIDGRGWYVIIIFSITILLWLTDGLHGLPTAVSALVPAIAFTATGLIRRSDINSLEWHILLLIAGGIALGAGIQLSGLDKILISFIPSESTEVFALLALSTLLLSTFMSNTAASNLLIPIGVAIASGAATGVYQMGISIALVASLSMMLPVSTPPNAIAYGTGRLQTNDFIKAGGIIGVVGVSLVILLSNEIISFWLS